MNGWEFRLTAQILLLVAAFLTAIGAIARRERNATLACWAVGFLWAATQI